MEVSSNILITFINNIKKALILIQVHYEFWGPMKDIFYRGLTRGMTVWQPLEHKEAFYNKKNEINP